MPSQAKKEGFSLSIQEALIGGAALDATGVPLPDVTLDTCKASDAVLLAAIGGYKWDTLPAALRPERGLLGLRAGLQAFANLRPATILPQLLDASTLKREVVEGTDIMVVRELTGGIYFGQPKVRGWACCQRRGASELQFCGSRVLAKPPRASERDLTRTCTASRRSAASRWLASKLRASAGGACAA